MPSWVRDEKKWAKAKKLAAEQGHAGEYDYITGIYKKLGGPIAGKTLNKSLLSFIRQYSQGGSGGHKYYARVPAPEAKVGTHHTAWKYFYTKKAYDRYLGGPQIKGSPAAQRPGKPKRVFEKPKPVGTEAGDQGVARRQAEDDSRTEQAGKATAGQTARLGLPQQIPVDEKRSDATVGRLKFYCVVDNRDSVPAGTRLYVSKAEARKEKKKDSGNLLVSATIGPSYLDVGKDQEPKLRLGVPIEKAMQARFFIDLRKTDIFRKPPPTGPPPIQRKNPGLQLIPSKINPQIRRWQMPGGVDSGEVKSSKEEPQEKKAARKFSKGDQISFLREGGETSAEVVQEGDQLVAFKTEDGKTGTVRADKAKKKPYEQVEIPGMPKRQVPQTKIGAGKGTAPINKLPLFVKQAPRGARLGLPVRKEGASVFRGKDPQTFSEFRNWEFKVPSGGGSKTPKTVFDWRESKESEEYETLHDLSKQKDDFRFKEVLGKGWKDWGTTLHLSEKIRKNEIIEVYRAVEKKEGHRKILPGAYVTESKEYAKAHGEGILREDYEILSMKLKPSELFVYGDPHEFLYYPESAKIAFQRYKSSESTIKKSLGIRVKDWVGARLGLRKAISPTKAPPLPGQKGAPLAQHRKHPHLVLRIGPSGKRHWMLPSPKEKKGRPPKKAEEAPAPRTRAPEEGTTAPKKRLGIPKQPAKKYKKGQGVQFEESSGERHIGKVIKTGDQFWVVRVGPGQDKTVHVDDLVTEKAPTSVDAEPKIYPILRPFKETVTPNTADYIAGVLVTTKGDVKEHGGIERALGVLQDLYPEEKPGEKGKYLYCCTFAKDLGEIARGGLQSNLDPHWGGYTEDEGSNGVFYTEKPRDVVEHAETIWKTGFEGGAESMSDPIVFRVEKEKVKHLKMTEGGESFGSIPGAENYEVWFRGGWGRIELPSITAQREMVPSRMEKVRKEAKQAIIDQIKRQKGDFIFHADESVTKILRVGHCVHYLRQGYLNVNGVVEQVLKNGAWIRDETGQQFEISNDQLLVLACPEQYRTKSVQKHIYALGELIKDVGKRLDAATKEQKNPDLSSLNFKQVSKVVSFGLLNEAARLLDSERREKEKSPGKPRVEYKHKEIAGHIKRERGSLEAKIRDYLEGPPREEKGEEEIRAPRVKLAEHQKKIVDDCSDAWKVLTEHARETLYEVLNQEFDFSGANYRGTKAQAKEELSKYFRPYSVAADMFHKKVISDKYRHRWITDGDHLWDTMVRYAKKASGRKTGLLSSIITKVFGPVGDWAELEDVEKQGMLAYVAAGDIDYAALDLLETQRVQKLEDAEAYETRPRDEFEVRKYYSDILKGTMKSLGVERDNIDTDFLTDPKKRDTFLDKALEISKEAEIRDWRTGWHGSADLANMGPVAIKGAAREHKDVRELVSDIAAAQAKGGAGSISKEGGERLLKETMGLMYDEQIEEDLTVALTRMAKETEYRNKNADKVAGLRVQLMELKRDLKSYKGILAGKYESIPVAKSILGIKEGMRPWANLKVGLASSPKRIGVRAVIEK